MDDKVPVSVTAVPESSDEISVSSDSPAEVKRESDVSGEQQVMAQTVVFSFLKHKQNIDKPSNFLVPGIGVCGEKLLLYMYDCEEDVLLEVCPVGIFSNGGPSILDVNSVVVLWLLLNYRIFGNCVPDEFKQYKSEFHQQLGDHFLDMYMNKVERPCHVKSSDNNVNAIWSNICCVNAEDFYSRYLTDSKSISLNKLTQCQLAND